MIRSMTGYGSSHATQDGVSYSVEIRCLNNRHFKSSVKLPEGYAFLEAEVDRWLRESLDRGSISFTLRVRDESPTAAADVNIGALRGYLEKLRQLKIGGDGVTVDVATLMTLPGVCESPDLDDATRQRRAAAVEQFVRRAVAGVLEMRRVEGEALRRHMLEQCDAIRRRLAAVAERSPLVVGEYQQKLAARVERLLGQAQLDLDRDMLTREVALFADRCDISEEVARLNSHLDQFRGLCDSEEPAGRRLDFLSQEMVREANTIGSKANDVAVAQHVVEIKAAIERLKEQVQNVE